MTNEGNLAWVTFFSGLIMFFVLAGPGSHWPLAERLLAWFAAVSLLGASIFRLVAVYDPSVSAEAEVIGYTVMVAGRGCVILVGLYLIARHVYRCNPRWRTPVEQVSDLVAGHRR